MSISKILVVLLVLSVLLLSVPVDASLNAPTSYGKGFKIYGNYWDGMGEALLQNSTNNIQGYSYILMTSPWNNSALAINGTAGVLDYSSTDANLTVQNVLNSTGPKKILVKSVFYVSQLKFNNDTYIECTGWDAGFRQAGAAPSHMMINNVTKLVNVTIKNCRLDGNQQAQTGPEVRTILFNGSTIKIKDNYFINSRHGSVDIQQDQADVNSPENNEVTGNIFDTPWQDSGTDHVRISAYSNTVARGNIISNNIVKDALNNGIHLYRNAADNIVSDNIIMVQTPLSSTSAIELAKGDLAGTLSMNNTVSGNQMYVTGATGQGIGVLINGRSKGDNIYGNTCVNLKACLYVSSGTVVYGLFEDGAFTNNRVYGASFDGIYINGSSINSKYDNNKFNESNSIIRVDSTESKTGNNVFTASSVSGNNYRGNASGGVKRVIFLRDLLVPGNDNSFDDNIIYQENGTDAISVKTSNSTIQNNKIWLGNGTMTGILVNASWNNTISGNIVRSNSPNTGGIQETTGANSNEVIQNNLESVTTKLTLIGSFTAAYNNRGAAPYYWGGCSDVSKITPFGIGDTCRNTTTGKMNVYGFGNLWMHENGTLLQP